MNKMVKNGMSLNKKRRLRKPLVLLISAAVLLAVLAAGYFVYKAVTQKDTASPSAPNTINYDSPTDEQKKAGSIAKQEALDKDPGTQTPTNPSDNGKISINVTITRAEQSSDGTVQVSAIAQTVESDGTCTLKLTRESDGKVVTKTSSVFKQSSYSACADFIIPKSEVPGGNWQLTVSYSSPKSAGSSSQDMVIN